MGKEPSLISKIFGKIVLDHITLVALTDHRLIDAMTAVDLENMPQYRHATNLSHRPGLEMGCLADTNALPSGQDHSLHRVNRV
jgi:hypothetical protein